MFISGVEEKKPGQILDTTHTIEIEGQKNRRAC